MSGEAQRAAEVRAEQDAEDATCPACHHGAHDGGPCDAWWIAPGTGDVEISCGCQGAHDLPDNDQDTEDRQAAGEAAAARFELGADPWHTPNDDPPPF